MAEPPHAELRRLRRSVILLGAAGLFFLVSTILHLAKTGDLRLIDVAVPVWAMLFVGYWRRYRAAQKRNSP